MIKDLNAIKETYAYLVPETVAGQTAFPAAQYALLIAGTPMATQTPNSMESPEIFNSLSVIKRCKTQNPAGEWSLPVVLHQSGVAGTVPNEGNLLKGLLGKETVTSGTSVTYEPKIGKGSYTLWYKIGHSVFFCTGLTVEKGDFKISSATDCYARLDLSGKFMRRRWVGSAELTAALPTGTTVTVGVTAIKRFCVDGYVSFEKPDGTGVSDNAGAGYKITAVNYSAGTFTVASAPGAFAVGDHVKAFLLHTALPVGADIEGKYIGLYLGGVQTANVSVSISFTAAQFYPEDESTASQYPERYTDGDTRAVTASISAYFLPKYVEMIRSIEENETVTLSIKSDIAKVAAGQRLEIYGARFRPNKFDIQEAAPVYKVSIEGTLDGTSGEDEIEVIYS
jgi:hypothetical protein